MNVFKSVLIPGSASLLIIGVVVGTALLYRRADRGRAGRVVLTVVALFYWISSTPLTLVFLMNVLTPDCSGLKTPAQAAGADGIVVLSAGLEVYRSRGDVYEVSDREDALRVMEAARVYRLLNAPWVIVTGGGGAIHTLSEHMSAELAAMHVPPDRIVEEARARDTRGHALFVPLLLREHNVHQFVLVTSRQHMARALGVFRKAGWNPVPSCPEFFAQDDGLKYFLPSRGALDASYSLWYDLGGLAYYKLRGWI